MFSIAFERASIKKLAIELDVDCSIIDNVHDQNQIDAIFDDMINFKFPRYSEFSSNAAGGL
jgi:hypothetical protein